MLVAINPPCIFSPLIKQDQLDEKQGEKKKSLAVIKVAEKAEKRAGA